MTVRRWPALPLGPLRLIADWIAEDPDVLSTAPYPADDKHFLAGLFRPATATATTMATSARMKEAPIVVTDFDRQLWGLQWALDRAQSGATPEQFLAIADALGRATHAHRVPDFAPFKATVLAPLLPWPELHAEVANDQP